MKKIIKMLLSILIYSFLLPSGTVCGLQIKTIFSMILLIITLFKSRKINDYVSLKFFAILLLIIVWSMISIFNGFSTYFNFFKNYFSLLLIVWLVYELIQMRMVSFEFVSMKIMILSYLIIFLKIITSLLMSFKFISVDDMIYYYKNFLNTDLTTMYFPIGNFMFYRVMVSNDYIPFIYFSFYLFWDKRKIRKILFVLLMSFYSFIIFSRVIFGEFFILVICSIFCHMKNSKLYCKSNRVFLVLSICIFVFAIVCFFSNTNLFQAILFRFSSNSTVESDNIRNEQQKLLMAGIKDSVFIGHGTGSYLKNYIRSKTTPYSYELEYFSFLYQFGIVGFTLIILTTIVTFYKIIFSNITNKYLKLIAFINFALWLIKPFFNPGFISSNSGIIIICIYVFVGLSKNKIDAK